MGVGVHPNLRVGASKPAPPKEELGAQSSMAAVNVQADFLDAGVFGQMRQEGRTGEEGEFVSRVGRSDGLQNRPKQEHIAQGGKACDGDAFFLHA